MTEKRVSINIQDGKSFFADEVSITNNPLRIILDFKNTTPRIDVRAQQQGVPLVVEHNTVILDAFLAKTMYELLGKQIEQYEEQFGEITEPPQVTQAKEKAKHLTASADKPGYFG